jgi:hypothetical protein
MTYEPTSYFSEPEAELDPTLFQGRVLRSWVRQGINTLLRDFFDQTYRHSELWAHAWLAGSGVSYQWSASRQPGDLDCLVGVDYPQFRKANPEYRGLSDTEVSEQINEDFRNRLQPTTENWNGYELTFYVNPGATDIRSIKPYAAYDLKYDEWTVTPDPHAHAPSNPAWEQVVDSDRNIAKTAITRFTTALSDLKMSHNGPQRRNAESRLSVAGSQAMALYDEIHENRGQAFSKIGEGYADFHNYRWQAGKREGIIQSLRDVRKSIRKHSEATSAATYGVELPDSATLIRRAATYRNK